MAESAEETEARLAKWTKFLESEEGKKSSLVENHNAGLAGAEEEEEEDQDSDEENTKKEEKEQPISDNSVLPVDSSNI